MLEISKNIPGLKGGKNTVSEGGFRVLLFLRLSGLIKPGQDLPQLARHIDILPT
ncbi:hypothetical protein V2O64_24355 (plasmid) [Verrucomicrobiaceae bacterium 227]